MKRYKIIEELKQRRISTKEATQILGVSYRHVLRLKKRYEEKGVEGLKFLKRGRGPKMKESERKFICYLYSQIYENRLNIMHFKEKLEEEHFIKYSYETIRQILIKAGFRRSKRRKIKYRKRRKRMPKEGMLVQMDSSYHRWLENIEEEWYLIAMIDDASNKVYSARFYEKDTTFNNMEVIKDWIKKKGVFMALYADGASHFTTTRHQGIHYNISKEQKDTQIERALEELSINLIIANSPQAKGRIERLFKTFQDRLINELYFNNIKDYHKANIFLSKKFVPSYNRKFALKNIKDLHKPLAVHENLDLIFTKRFTRTVRNDFTISFMKETIQLPPSIHKLSLRNSVVQLRLNKNFKLFILYNDKIIHSLSLDESNKLIKKQLFVDSLLKHRSYQNA